jgi:hypothetical protein
MRLDDPESDLGLLQGRQPNQAQDACVRQLADDGELAEVLVERDEDAPSASACAKISSSPGSAGQ